MEFTRYQVLLAVVMVATGSINTLSTKLVIHNACICMQVIAWEELDICLFFFQVG